MHQQSWEQIWSWETQTLASRRSDSVSGIRQGCLIYVILFLNEMLFPYPWCLLHQTSLAALFMGFNAPSCLQSLNLHISAALPLQIDSATAWDPKWDTISHKQRHRFGLLYYHILELHKGERCVKRTTSLFQTINILWVCWAPSHMKLYYSISTHRRTLSKSRNSGECSRCLPDTEVLSRKKTCQW